MNQFLRWLLPLLLITSPVFAGDEQVTLEAMSACRKEPAALERLDCYDRILAPQSDSGFAGALVKARYDGEARKRAFEQEAQRADNSTALLLTRTEGEHPTVVITTPAIGSLPPRPVLMFSCVDNITRMQVALSASRQEHDIPVTLKTESGAFRSRWFVRENGFLLEASRGLSGIDEIKQLFGARTLTLETGNGGAGQLIFNIDGLAQTLVPLREACHWAGE
ncbi:type VI secretion system-associated protein TagO [Salmonella enterica subsp. enterica serovar Anecho]|uniref:Type VI secretion system-associated protein TagO n=1 Tax=Salmonella enterica subsp. enterica serovar Tamberma TaxID=2565079 RepID=A0A5X9FNX5_SALET|nr:type VI secretion system-associated protein TagO [Salmonella enterica subsp. enterica serovar Anecho]EBU0151402.1 type VI secretion system-associated protein TagO [Salmonella enterica]EBV4674443.1 type VI secretion system-associated protein TagO [Salmonella enterica subsp. enterica serovar Tamberma]EBR9235505.1 type VI secretion system-associated protein TagO [Salmonella enterica subsp. enterica serovar Anecho]EBS5061918.1 type VI secretion system-associated protein TagO [Salmonella enterica